MSTLEAQIDTYREDGFMLVPELFSVAQIDLFRKALPELLAENSARRVLEKDGSAVRSVYGAHLTHAVFRELTCQRRLLSTAEQIIGDRVYVHQFKINAKVAVGGDVWAWHQDYVFWRDEDGRGAPKLTTAIIFVDEVNEFNGPLLLLRGSHTGGVVEPIRNEVMPIGYEDSPGWVANLTADLKYSLDRETVMRVAKEKGIVAPKGRGGSVLFLHPNTLHASAPNMSPFDRVLILITYNSVENRPRRLSRPDFLCGRDYRPLQATGERRDDGGAFIC